MKRLIGLFVLYSILIIGASCMMGCSWHVRNEARFVVAPWEWVPPTPRILEDNPVEGYDVQVAITDGGSIIGCNDDGSMSLDDDKYYCWGKRIVGSDPNGGIMDRIMVPDWVAKLHCKGNVTMKFRQRCRVTGGHVVWYGWCDISKPFLVCAGSAWYNTHRF